MKRIAKAVYLGGYLIGVFFEDGKMVALSLKSYLEESKNPLIRQYLDRTKFAKFEVSPFRLHWENSLDISSEWIYDNIRPNK